MITETLTPPDSLSAASQSWWVAMVEAYDFRDDVGGLALLDAAAVQLDRMLQCREAIADVGPSVVDRFGIRKANPLLAEERASSNLFRLLIRELDLSDGDDEVARIPRHGR